MRHDHRVQRKLIQACLHPMQIVSVQGVFCTATSQEVTCLDCQSADVYVSMFKIFIFIVGVFLFEDSADYISPRAFLFEMIG